MNKDIELRETHILLLVNRCIILNVCRVNLSVYVFERNRYSLINFVIKQNSIQFKSVHTHKFP